MGGGGWMENQGRKRVQKRRGKRGDGGGEEHSKESVSCMYELFVFAWKEDGYTLWAETERRKNNLNLNCCNAHQRSESIEQNHSY